MDIATGMTVALVVGWVVVNVAGWWGYRDGPWNWRVLAGPDVYYRWLDRRNRDLEGP